MTTREEFGQAWQSRDVLQQALRVRGWSTTELAGALRCATALTEHLMKNGVFQAADGAAVGGRA